jgi:hypothetical protein
MLMCMAKRKSYPWRGEICKCCLRPNIVGFDLTDEGWEQIVQGRFPIVCLSCLDALAKEKGIDWVPYLKYRYNTSGEKMYDLYPCSSVGWSE